jgi:2-polyprenyl-6-methoxyphenol hydroxylase-like FAD-dependent oxidoreductase
MHAVVIGAGMGGLFQAKVLTEAFSKVTVLERDTLSNDLATRRGVPQANHNHVLVLGGYRAAVEIFPGLVQSLIANGALAVDWYRDLKMYRNDGWRPRYVSGAAGITSNRVTLEKTVRAELSKTQVEIIDDCEVQGLLRDADRNCITGVAYSKQNKSHTLECNLVVDTSGRSGGSRKWLSDLDYPPPWETFVDPLCSYSTRWYSKLSPGQYDWKLFKVAENRDYGRVASIVQTQVDEWVVTLQGFLGDYPPFEETGFLEFARSLPVSDVYDAIKYAVPKSTIFPYRRMQNVWKHYERVRKWPENYIVAGDANCILNPAYGLGMAAAIKSAQLTGALLRKDGLRAGFSKRYQKRLAKTMVAPWLITTEEPLWYRSDFLPIGGLAYDMQKNYYKLISKAANSDEKIWDLLQEVLQLARPASDLLRPSILARALKHARGFT